MPRNGSQATTPAKEKKHGEYRRTSSDERLLAILLIESGRPSAEVAEIFGVSQAGVEMWVHQWKTRWHRRGEELRPAEIEAGYIVVAAEAEEWDGWHKQEVRRGPTWSCEKAAAAARPLARACFVSALADTRSMVAPSKATMLGIGRVYRVLDAEAQALFTPVWDQCQLAIDEIESGRQRLARASALLGAVQEAA